VSRPRRTAIVLGLVAALAGGTFVAQAPEASAATGVRTATVQTATAPAPNVKITVQRKTIVKGKKRAIIRARAERPNGQKVVGKARMIVNGDVVRVRKLVDGKVRFKPAAKRYHIGRNTVRVVIVPAYRMGLRIKSSESRTVRVKPAINPVVAVAKRYVGSPYVYGGSSPSGFDCSGFTSYVYKKAVGKTLPRSSSAQRSAGTVVSRKNARPGDLIWTPGHVAIYIGGGQQIDAGHPGTGVVKRSIWQDNPTFVRI
jgi:cell wall-associated NlpC family hydrolase